MAVDQNLCKQVDTRNAKGANIINEDILFISEVCSLIVIQKRADVFLPNRKVIRGFKLLDIDECLLFFP